MGNADQPRTSAPLLMDARGAARLVGVSTRTWWAFHSAGRTPLPIRLGCRCTRWRRAELIAWIEAGCPARDRWHAMTRLRPGYGGREGGRP